MQDILMNDEVKLDNTFKLSLMTDVAKGMEYLHKSHLHSHGNLKSSNCLVDGRWTVRVRLNASYVDKDLGAKTNTKDLRCQSQWQKSQS